MKRKYPILTFIALLLALALSWVLSGFNGVQGWASFLAVLALGALIIFPGLRALQGEGIPRWLTRLTLGAALLRLAAGVLWFAALPAWGYDTEVQQAGYVMEDAFQRDTVAWKLAQSGQPLSKAFTGYRTADQYGGLLFVSAAVYRFLGGETHTPLLMVAFAAAFSALAVPFTWAFSRRLFGEHTAKWAAWGIAFYPEAVLLGSSQMREAFLMPLVAAAFYGLARYWQTRTWGGVGWVLSAFAISLVFSPPMAGILLGLLALVGLAMDDWRVLRSWRLWALIGGMAFLVVAALWLGWDQIAPRLADRFGQVSDIRSPLAMVGYWLELSARWQAKQTAEASGWVQKTIRETPEWFNLPFLMSYGIVRPLLPAQLMAWSIPIWYGIGVWRALGWTLLLPLLVYAPLRAFRASEKRNLLIGLSIAVWVGILFASFWGGGDQWDNPRYRVSFISLQIALAAWVIIAQRHAPDPWMRRALVSVLAILAWFLPWYLRRYTYFDQVFGWTVVDLFKLLGLGVASAVLYVVGDLAIRNPGAQH